LFPAEAPDLQNGRDIFASKCAPCHGSTGLGDGAQGKQLPVPVAALGLPEAARPASPARWFTVVSQGNIERYMPPFTSLLARDRWDVVGYALSLHAAPEMLQQGKALFEQNCSGCDAGFFKDQEKMAALSEDDLARMVREGGEGLTAFGAGLSDDQVYAVAAYLRSLSFAASAPATATVAVTLETPAVSGTPGSEIIPGAGTPAAQVTPGEGTAFATLETTPAAVATVTGTVVNKTGQQIPAGTIVTLRAFDHAQDSSGPKETLTLESELAPDGSYTFEDVELPAGRILVSELSYQGITYQAPFKSVQGGESELALDPITVYESSDDYTGLVVDQLHIAFDFGTGEKVQVFQIFSFSNKTDRAVVVKTDGSQVPFIKVPEGAQDAGVEAGQDTAPYTPATDGVAFLPSDKPYSLISFYTLPYDSKGTTIVQPLVLETDAVSVFAPEGIKLKSEDLADAGKQDISGTSFKMYSSEQLAAGSDLTFTLSGKPDLTPSAATPTGTSSRQAIIYGAAALGLVLIGLGVWMYLRDRKAGREPGDALDDDEDDEFEDEESILDAIIALDDLHRAGKIPDEAYQARRSELKEQLKKMEGRG
jgi:mono/diheme cytochrome c family protein